MAANNTTYDPLIRELWPEQRVNDLAFVDAPALALMPKDETFSEKIRHIALQYGNLQSRGVTVALAQTAVDNAKFEDFAINRVSDFAVGQVNGDTLEATESNKAALVNAIERETKSALFTLSRQMHKNIWGTGSGKIGRISGTPTTSLTLANVEDSVNLEEGMRLWAATTETGAVRSTTDVPEVTTVNTETGVIGLSTDVSAFGSAWANNDYLFQEGDSQNGGSAAKLMVGIPGWVPIAAPTATLWFGVNRTAHITRLGGVRVDGTAAGSIREALLKGVHRLMREGKGCRPELGFIHPEDLGSLVIEMQGQVTYEKLAASDVSVRRSNGSMGKQKASIGFEAVVITSSAGPLKLLSDFQVPRGYCWLVKMSTFKMNTLKAAPRIITYDGNRQTRLAADDGVEFRAVARGQTSCDAPGWNAVVSLPQ